MGLRLQSVIRMKLLVLLAFVALAQAEAQPDAVAAPEADADAGLYGYHYPYYNYGYYGFPRYFVGRKRREADAGLYGYHYPYYNYGYHGFPRYVFGRKRRDAEARQRLMLMPDIMDTILIMAMEDTMATILDKHYAELERDAYSGNLHVSAHLASSTNQNIKSEQFSFHLVQKFTLMFIWK